MPLPSILIYTSTKCGLDRLKASPGDTYTNVINGLLFTHGGGGQMGPQGGGGQMIDIQIETTTRDALDPLKDGLTYDDVIMGLINFHGGGGQMVDIEITVDNKNDLDFYIQIGGYGTTHDEVISNLILIHYLGGGGQMGPQGGGGQMGPLGGGGQMVDIQIELATRDTLCSLKADPDQVSYDDVIYGLT